MTNFEMIKNISLEELAYTLSVVITNCYKCPIRKFCDKNNSRNFRTCRDTWEQWLKSEVEE